MIKIISLHDLRDNYIRLIHNEKNALVIDPGQAEQVLSYLYEKNLVLREIWLTHHHSDHIGGVDELRKNFPDIKIFGAKSIACVNNPVIDGMTDGIFSMLTIKTAGHTQDGHSYLLNSDNQQHLFCGDILFSAGCGRVFEGTTDDLRLSLKKIAQFPDDTLLYPAHEYTHNNLLFAHSIEPDDDDIASALQNLPAVTLPTSIGRERKINLFLRYVDDAQKFADLRRRKDEF